MQLTGFEGKVAVVTGAGRMRSIGRETALALARAGCDVVVTGTGRTPDRYTGEERAAGWRDIDSVVAEIRELGRRADAVVCDIADEPAVDALVRKVTDDYGRVDIVVNNAAAARAGDRVPVLELPTESWDAVLRVNLRGTFLVSRAFARAMVARADGAGGSIVNISSIAGKLGGANTAAYAASKAGVQALTSSMAKELGPAGIRVNAICPGVTGTSRLDDLPAEAWRSYVEANLPLQRVGDAREVAWTVVFLASEQAGWVTGQSWNVDGGQLTVR
ncbi:SDR family oxidoreductase [Nocardia flavorosea]|uniref:SDR family NAD(P)-dependent oxidoreductase n=1 Tax=Nocardia flavorosea TaxID=53429 RepID=UPI0018962A19|nr:SDR family oxidoreductase [Nocardia flavorosea]MBF6347893.1 SDR family oxidoreductase [Nocardia flavorosea]